MITCHTGLHGKQSNTKTRKSVNCGPSQIPTLTHTYFNTLSHH